ncbi:MAG: hypothetical protein K2H82_07940 [Oscillospiraceae bacterium]|nr:hypothetical protein [Oscillospiraceae bacterium]
MLFRKNTLKSNISGKLTAVFGTVAISMLLCTGTAAHAAVLGNTSTTAVQSKSNYQNSIEINADEFSQVLQDYWNEAIQEASWDSAKTTTATQSKSKYQSPTQTTTTTQSKSEDQSSTKTTTTQSKSKDQSPAKTTTTQNKSKYQSSTKTTTATQDKLKYKKYNENFDPDKTMHLTKSGKIFQCDNLKTWYFYHFSDRSFNGFGYTGEVLHGLSNRNLFSAIITENRNLIVVFKANENDAKLNDITIESNNNTTEKLNYTFNPDKNCLQADLYDASFRNGLYRITLTCNDTEHAYIYLYINCASNDPKDYEFYLCYAEQHDYSENFDPMKRQKYITDLIESEGVTILNSTDNSYIVYPSVATKDNCDTPFWINKAHEIIEDPSQYSDPTLAYILHDWMTINLTYDWFKINCRGGYQRYYKTKFEADPSQYMSQNNTGVCLDYTIVYTIMCRELDVPCVVLSNNSHAWNAVNIGGEWVEVDITADINRYTYNEDVTDVTGTQLYDYSGFMTYAVNDALPDTATRFCFQ